MEGKGHVFIRPVVCNSDTFNHSIMKKIHHVVYDKPYDIVPKDWIEAFFKNCMLQMILPIYFSTIFFGFSMAPFASET